MERFSCMDCHHTGELNVRGCCGTCGSQAVVTEHWQRRCTDAEISQYVAQFPGHRRWVVDAQQILRAHQRRKQMRVV